MEKHDLRLKDKVTVITGAAGGIGQAIARLFVHHGAALVLTGIRKRNWDKISPSINARNAEILWVEHDVRDPESWRFLMDRILSDYGRLDILVNNAGTLHPGAAEDLTLDEVQEHIDVNLQGTIYGCQAALHIMKKQQSGKIINVASLGGIVPMPWVAVYSATKFAVRGYSLSLYAELLDSPVQISVVCPDSVATPLLAHELTHDKAVMAFIGQPMEPARVARSVLRVACKDMPEMLIPTGMGVFARTGMAFPRIFFALFPLLKKIGNRTMTKMRRGEGKWQYHSMLQ
jgi:3-oxoacyl-[acyl-carrier protein] reductase